MPAPSTPPTAKSQFAAAFAEAAAHQGDTVVQVDVHPTQRNQFAPTQTRQRRGQDENSKLRSHGIGEREDLGSRGHRPFGREGLVSTADPARVPLDPPVVQGSVQDRAEQSVCLGRRPLRASFVRDLGSSRTDMIRLYRTHLLVT